MAKSWDSPPVPRCPRLSHPPRIRMTLQEFEATRHTLACRQCGTVGVLRTRENPNNRGIHVVCPHCDCRDPLGGRPFLSQRGPRPRRPALSPDASLEAVWAQWGDQCAGCGTTTAWLQRLGIGRHRQHAPPLATVTAEAETTLLPLCALCHEHVTATQRAMQAIVRALAEQFSVPPHPLDFVDTEQGHADAEDIDDG
jgi:ribosomal protein S14